MCRPGQTVLDVGAGSGILAIAAAKLGAARLLAFDTDELAVSATVDNAAKNGVAGQISVFKAH
ncbi:MAG: 50S ribosomal protein L11 methyltransferase [Chloroflexi bacterium]|nr:50S ribosomal protein L11 methyltransferase [Chloroflexota bacterium]